MSKTTKTTKKVSKTAQNVAMVEAVKSLEKQGKKVVAGKAKKAEVIVETPTLDELLLKVESVMAGRSVGTINSAKNLITKVCKQYNVINITEEIARRAIEESKAAPKSLANLRWAMKIAVAASH